MIARESVNEDGDTGGVYAQRYDADGNKKFATADRNGGAWVWEAESGQVQLDFSVRELADNVADLAARNLAQLPAWKSAKVVKLVNCWLYGPPVPFHRGIGLRFSSR